MTTPTQLLRGRDVLVADVVLRDGLQIFSDPVAFTAKQTIFDLLTDSGVGNLEITSMVPPHVVPQFGDAAQMIEHAAAYGDVFSTVLVPNLKGAQRAIEAGANSIVLPVSISETHSRKNIRKSRDEQVAELSAIRSLIDSQPSECRPLLAVGVSAAFGCAYEGRVAESEVFLVTDQCLSVGVDEIGLADTVGYGTPGQVNRAFKRLLGMVDDNVEVRAHFHDTYGMGLANVYAALDAGVKIFDASLCGLGGCPFAPNATGNVALEDLVLMLQKSGLRTGIDLDRLLTGFGELRRILPDAPTHGALHRAGRYPADFVPEQTPAALGLRQSEGQVTI